MRQVEKKSVKRNEKGEEKVCGKDGKTKFVEFEMKRGNSGKSRCWVREHEIADRQDKGWQLTGRQRTGRM